MKIIQILPELNEGGVERGVMDFNKEFVKLGYTSIVVSKKGKLSPQIHKDGGQHIELDVCSKNIFTLPYRILKLRQLIKSLSPDIIHARSRLPAWMVYFANKGLEFNFVTTIHGLNSIKKYSKIMTMGDRVIAVGDAVKQHVVKGYSLNPDEINVINRGVDIDEFNPENINTVFLEEFKNKHNLKNRYVISSIGRVTWLKDYETFIKAISKVKATIPNVTGLIVGGVRQDKQDYLNSLKDLTKKYQVEDNIIFAGSQSNIAEVYYLSNIVVNASLKMGNIGRTIVESLAMNTPVIATSYEGLTNIIEDGVNGYLIKTKDTQDLTEKILLARQTKFLSVRKSLNPDYTLNVMLQKTVKIYKELL